MKHAYHIAGHRAFTLVELLTVISIMGILVAAAMPAYFNSVRTSRLNSANSNARTIAIAVQAVAMKTGGRAYTDLDLSNSAVLKQLSNMIPFNECASSTAQGTSGGWTITISGSGDSTWTITPANSSLCTAAPAPITLTGS
ncbi:MAG: type II secretion system protein [Fimbriimonas sp.]